MKRFSKKCAVLLLIASMLTSLLAGCGGGETTGNDPEAAGNRPLWKPKPSVFTQTILPTT